jgi:uncharacterized protein
MPIPMSPKEPINLDALDAFLMSDRAPEDSMGLSDLDGFLTGVVVGPELIMPSEWTRVIWGGEGPDFESMEEALAINGAMTGRYNEILRCLDSKPESLDPVFWEGPEGKVIVTDWAAGFLDAVKLRSRAWEPLLRHKEASVLIAPLLALGADDPEHPPFGGPVLPRDEIERLHAHGPDIVRGCVIGIHAFWRQHRRPSGAGGARRAGRGANRLRRA